MVAVSGLVAKSCPTIETSMDCNPPGFPCPLDFPGKNTGVGCHFLLQGIFLTQGLTHISCNKGFSGGVSGTEPASPCRRCKRFEFDPWVGKIPWRRKWQPTPAFLPGESHGQRTLGAAQSIGSHRVGHDWAPSTHTPVFQPVSCMAGRFFTSEASENLTSEIWPENCVLCFFRIMRFCRS